MKPPFRNLNPAKSPIKTAANRPSKAVTSVHKLFLQAFALHEQSEWQKARSAYEQVLVMEPGHVDALHLAGVLAAESKDHRRAVALMSAAIALSPGYAIAHCNLGKALRELGQTEAAVKSLDRAIALKPDYLEAYNARGDALAQLKRFRAAAQSYERVLALNPDYPFARGARLHMQMQLCDWAEAGEFTHLAELIAQGARIATPFAMAALSSELAVQKIAAQTWVGQKYPERATLPAMAKQPRRGKIRLGYFSADFHNHATTYLLAEMLEKHDRQRFELFAFSFGPDKNDEMRQRVSAAFDKFIDVRAQTDEEVALLSRQMGIDIAIDLKGFTTDARAGIFACRAAPVQVSYLGFPGTMGAGYMDYLIADHTLIPDSSRQHYVEKIVYLPNSYQVNDSRRPILDKVFTRHEAGLPERGFVFCCFNNNYKITPVTFSGWMRILLRVEGSVLWLLEDNPEAALNLCKEAAKRGVDAQRLVFAQRMPFASHLARHRLADLFLDTLPYNAHTTASDALWAGLPVLTRMGESFASRVAASLLHAVGLPELVTTTQERYETLAVGLSSQPQPLGQLKRRLEANRLTTPLFDTALFCRHIEAAYGAMYDRCQDGLPPDHLDIKMLLPA